MEKPSLSRVRILVFIVALVITVPPLYGTIVVLPPDDPSEAACFSQDVNDALAAIRKTDPVFDEMITFLQASGVRHTIKQTDGITTSDGFHDGHQEIQYNPRLNKKFSDGVCVDPIAALLHELYHALQNQTGDLEKIREIKTADTNYIRLSEINAVNAENMYRRLHGLCPRVSYGGIPLPKNDIVGACSDPVSVPCPAPKSNCQRCCCWVFGLVTTPAALCCACIKDNITPSACYAYNQPGKVSAGCYGTPCNFPGTQTCP